MTISIPSMVINLDNSFKVSARKQHELPGNQRVLSQRIGHKQHPNESPPNLETIPGSNTMIVDSGASINAEKWAQSEATEINSLIQSCAISPIYDGPVRTNAMKAPAISTYVSMRFATKPISSQSNFRCHYTSSSRLGCK